MEQYRDKYREIRQRLRDRNIRAVIACGSSTRDAEKADVYSDLDLMIITEDTDAWLYGDLPDKLGDLKISFVEPTLGGGKERRVLYRGNLDVDMIILSEAQLSMLGLGPATTESATLGLRPGGGLCRSGNEPGLCGTV